MHEVAGFPRSLTKNLAVFRRQAFPGLLRHHQHFRGHRMLGDGVIAGIFVMAGGDKGRPVVLGAENNWPSFVTTGHYKYAGYYTVTEHTMSPEVLVMSQKAWESLSAEDRKIFREAARKSSNFMHEKWRDLEDQSRRKAEAAGVTIITDFDRKPFEAAMAEIYAKAQRDPAATQLIER